MSETQLLSVALTTVPTMIVVLIGILINNARLGDLNSKLDTRLADVKEVLRAEMQVIRAEMERDRVETKRGHEALRGEMEVLRSETKRSHEALRAEMDKNHSEMLHRVGDLDTRLTRIEGSLHTKHG